MPNITLQHSLSPSFFSRPVLTVAEELIGKKLVRQHKGQRTEAIITETEAYDGPEDKACHGRFGKTERTKVMFGPAGYWYVYLCYGMHWMLNIVTGEEGYPAAVLIRGAGAWNGPGKLTKALMIDRNLNGCAATEEYGLWIEEGTEPINRAKIVCAPRIGIDYAEEWKDKPYRFVIAN